MRELIDLILPRSCAVCGTIIFGGEKILCFDCLASLPLTYFWSYGNNPAEVRFWGRVYFDNVASLFYYGDDSPYRYLIHKMKYDGREDIAIYLGTMLGRRLKESGHYNDIDLVTSVPVSMFKYWKRGYNQASVIAMAIARELDLEVVTDLLDKRLFSSSQVTKGSLQRWENASSSFSLTKRSKISGKSILLVDDVLTTGATLEACGSALLNLEGCSVSAVTLAYVE